MRTCPHSACGLFGRQNRANGEAAPNTLGHHHDIGINPCPFMGKQLPCAPDTTLHLIKNQQDPVAVAKIAQTFQTMIRHGADPALPLDRFNKYGSGFVTDSRMQRVVICKWQVHETGQ